MHKTKRPYLLPEPLTCDPAEVASGVSLKLAEAFIDKHEQKSRRYDYMEALYKGFHDVYKQPEKEDWKPDNRLAVNFPRYITQTFTGYGYGIPIKETHPDESVNDSIRAFCDANDMTDHEAELITKCCIYGHAWEYIYQDESAQTRVTECTPKELFVVYDDTMSKRALFAVRYGRRSIDGRQQGALYGEILTRAEIIRFDGRKQTERLPNPYGYIPCVEWRLNDERMGLYEAVAGLVEAYNHTLGEKANDVDAFAEAYLAVIGADVDEDGLYKIRDNRIINLYGTDDAKDILVQFLQKPTADGTQENLLDRLENLIYQTSMVANISDESFGNATSGTALAYKLQAMSNLALTFDRKITKSIKKRYKIWASLGTNTPDPDAWKEIDIKMTRNLPKNLAEEAQTAAQLSGVVSQETQLSVLSIVPDPKEEIERMEEESEAAQSKTLDLWAQRQQVGEADEQSGVLAEAGDGSKKEVHSR